MVDLLASPPQPRGYACQSGAQSGMHCYSRQPAV